MIVIIYKQSKNPMQSGVANTKHWFLEFEPESASRTDKIMGWIGGKDMKKQVRIKFESKEKAISYAKSNGLEYRIVEPKVRKIIPKSYSENFQ